MATSMIRLLDALCPMPDARLSRLAVMSISKRWKYWHVQC